ncbi:MAG: response regulator [Chthoniobacterales bacterium]|nr:response regulator [Chthoniobacterales bacterium]
MVEDHPDTRLVLSKLLTHCGYDVAAAENFREALQLLDTFRFDVLVSDIGLPDGCGLELVAEAKRRQRLRQTVALSAFGSEDDRRRGLRAGYDYYLTKPLDFTRLRNVLAEA